MINDNRLYFMRQQLLALLPDTAILQAVTRISDGAGSYIETWTPIVGGTVPCRLDPANLSRQHDQFALSEGLTSAYQLTLPYNAPLEADQRIVIGGDAYEIRRLATAHDWNVSQRVLVTKVE
ncbi:MAG: head-tail adaptor protein [Anaerolineae bacterium]|nr:head-tail adaptor protein [Anaerolineae bacterium]